MRLSTATTSAPKAKRQDLVKVITDRLSAVGNAVKAQFQSAKKAFGFGPLRVGKARHACVAGGCSLILAMLG